MKLHMILNQYEGRSESSNNCLVILDSFMKLYRIIDNVRRPAEHKISNSGLYILGALVL